MGAFIAGVYHEHADHSERDFMPSELDREVETMTAHYEGIERLKAEAAVQHARIDKALAVVNGSAAGGAVTRAYSSVMDRDGGPAPLAPQGWVETPPTLEGIRERLATGAGDRTQLFADIRFLLAALAEPKP